MFSSPQQKVTEYDVDSFYNNSGQLRQKNLVSSISHFFNLTHQQKDEKGNLLYARNRNSKGKYVPVFITLTYPSNDDWNPTDISNFLKRYDMYAKRSWGLKLRYCWVAETTKAGVIHYHIVTWIPRNKRLPKPAIPIKVTYKNGNVREYSAPWAYWAKIESVRKSVYQYLVKYISKSCYDFADIYYECKDENGRQIYKNNKPLIKRPRIFGMGGLTKKERNIKKIKKTPYWVLKLFDYFGEDQTISRIKGGFTFKNTDNSTLFIRYGVPDSCPVKTQFKNYYGYFPDGLFIPSNYDIEYSELNGKKQVLYFWGFRWSYNPLFLQKDDVWYPF